MPLGTPQEVVGTLVHDGGLWVLRLVGGGYWYVDGNLNDMRAVAGQRVLVTGVRSGFNRLDATSFAPLAIQGGAV